MFRKYQNWEWLNKTYGSKKKKKRLIVFNRQNICWSVSIKTSCYACMLSNIELFRCLFNHFFSCLCVELIIQCRGCQFFDSGWRMWWCSHTPHWEKEISNTPKLPWRPPYGLPASQTCRVRGGAASTYMFYCGSICIHLSAMKRGSGRLKQLFGCSVTLQRC